jgi:Fe-S-cluster containining protein
VDFTYPADVRFECNRCGLCCGDTNQKTRHILILEVEAKKISLQTGLSKLEFSKEIEDKLPYAFELKKTSEGKCVFLKDNQCSIYPLRPLICIFYPFELKFDKDKNLHVFDFTVECPRINQGKAIQSRDFKKLFELAQERLRK